MTFEEVKRIRENPTAEDVDNKELSRMIDIAIEKQIPKKATTNFERIKEMSVEEMANFLMDFVTEALTNPKCIVVQKWLESEVQD